MRRIPQKDVKIYADVHDLTLKGTPGQVMGVRRNFLRGGQRRHFAYPFQVANDAMQMDVSKTLYVFCTTKEMSYVSAIVTKMRFVGSNRLFVVFQTGYFFSKKQSSMVFNERSIAMVFNETTNYDFIFF